MGDRANVIVDGAVLYTHWEGSELPEIVRQALIRGKSRWDDPSYLARIIFSQMIKDSLMDATGYGISTKVLDGSERVLIIQDQTISREGSSGRISFDDYIKEPRTWDNC